MSSEYLVKGRRLGIDDDALQDALAEIYNTDERPLCLCVPNGVPMYVAKYGTFVLKRMPDTGSHHHPTCYSFEPEPGVSGRAELGAAIEAKDNHAVELRLGFALSRHGGRQAPIPGDPSERPPGEVDAKVPRCSLRALLHFLWEEAGLHRWYPRMQGKRGQWTLHKHLLEQAKRVQTKGVSLAERLYIPEPFKIQDKEAIAQRRRDHLAFLHSPEANVVLKLGIVIGEFKGVDHGPTGMKLYVKHAPDAPLHMEKKSWERARRAYSSVLDLLDVDHAHKPHAVMAAVIHGAEGLYHIDSVAFMLVSEQWIPIDGFHDLLLVERLIEAQRTFIKPLRYDAKSAAQFPNALLLDAGDSPVHMHVIALSADEKTRRTKAHQVSERGSSGWLWDQTVPMPALPEVVARAPVATAQVTNAREAGRAPPESSLAGQSARTS